MPDASSPPVRFADATFDTYQATTPSQVQALDAAQAFAERLLRTRTSLTARIRRVIGGSAPSSQGLYFVGPVGTGKTHLLAAMYHTLHPDVPCAFLHSSALFRTTAPPERFADDLAATHDVLCLDEVEIDDPANEVRLVRTMHALEEHGVKLLATSNVKPEQFMSNRIGPGRFERFLQKEFGERYRLVFVGGDDYRQRKSTDGTDQGRGWIGPPDAATQALRAAYESADGNRCWMNFDALREASRTTAHKQLIDQLAAHDGLYLADIRIHDTDDALRLLRIVDDLYVRPDAPRLYFSAATPPEAWFNPADQHSGLAADIAKKFTRTTSRLQALCRIEKVNKRKSELEN